jgi:hypothetical protein
LFFNVTSFHFKIFFEISITSDPSYIHLKPWYTFFSHLEQPVRNQLFLLLVIASNKKKKNPNFTDFWQYYKISLSTTRKLSAFYLRDYQRWMEIIQPFDIFYYIFVYLSSSSPHLINTFFILVLIFNWFVFIHVQVGI